MTEKKLIELLQSMSRKEKVYQLVQLPGNAYEQDAIITGGLGEQDVNQNEKPALAGSTLGVYGAERLKKIQKEYLAQHPHHIPLLFMLDVIHGYRTIFPCPLGQGASFSPERSQACAEIAAREAAVSGLHVTFAPMVDLVRDARWGRVMESTGEDAYLNGRMGAAMVQGFQGKHVGEQDRVAACVKHFAGYGAVVAGLDYNNVELSEATLRDFYLPGYQTAIEAGSELVMTSFNTWNGIPATGNRWLMQDVLRREMGFEGVLISDWAAIGEMIAHGTSADAKDAAAQAMAAGVDIDMCADCYADELLNLLEEGTVTEQQLDEAVLRVLRLKNKLGLFENPYKDADEVREQEVILCKEHRQVAREAVRESIVLLKNEKAGQRPLLPLQMTHKVAFLGPYIEEQDMNSSWAIVSKETDQVSIRAAAEEVFAPGMVSFGKGCMILDNDTMLNLEYYQEEHWKVQQEQRIAEAVRLAEEAETVVLCLGEHRRQSGEATSRGDITLAKAQLELLQKVAEVNTNIVTLLFTGRPLDIREVVEYSKAVAVVWFPGTEGGHGILDVLTGAYNPSGKLPMSFPYSVAQAPISYDRYQTGRAVLEGSKAAFSTRYLDMPRNPLFAFGYGMSYTEFVITQITLSSNTLRPGETIYASVRVKNTGKYAGTEIVQLYLRDKVASRVRPERQLKGFERVTLQPGEECQVNFSITEENLRFYTANQEIASEPGSFQIWIGNSSTATNEATFELLE